MPRKTRREREHAWITRQVREGWASVLRQYPQRNGVHDTLYFELPVPAGMAMGDIPMLPECVEISLRWHADGQQFLVFYTTPVAVAAQREAAGEQPKEMSGE